MPKEKKPDPAVIRPLPDRCGLHGKVLTVPVKPEKHDHHIWICIVCVVNGMWNDDITEKTRKNWPEHFREGPLALKVFEKKESGNVRRKGATGV